MSSQICAASRRSWVMNTTAVPSLLLHLGDELDDARLDGDIERGGRLVRHQQLGRLAKAMAISTRWHMPPDS